MNYLLFIWLNKTNELFFYVLQFGFFLQIFACILLCMCFWIKNDLLKKYHLWFHTGFVYDSGTSVPFAKSKWSTPTRGVLSAV